MTDKLLTHFEFSSKGGKSRSPAKVAAVRDNLARARKIKMDRIKEKKQ